MQVNSINEQLLKKGYIGYLYRCCCDFMHLCIFLFIYNHPCINVQGMYDNKKHILPQVSRIVKYCNTWVP